MVFAARDLFDAGAPPPPDPVPPPAGSALFNYLIRRLFASFDLPSGPLKYLLWMSLSERGLGGARGTLWRTVQREWPSIKRDIDAGKPSPLGLVRATSLNPMDLGHNHQVLAYAYRLDEGSGDLRIGVYDPNHPGDDSIVLSLNVSGSRPSPIRYVAGELPVHGFFRTRYTRPTVATRRLLEAR